MRVFKNDDLDCCVENGFQRGKGGGNRKMSVADCQNSHKLFPVSQIILFGGVSPQLTALHCDLLWTWDINSMLAEA